MSAQRVSNLLQRGFDGFVMLLTTIAMVLLVPMMFLVTGDVIGRYLLNFPLPAVFEINTYFLMILVVFFPLATVYRLKEHVLVTLFTDRFPLRAREFLEMVSALLGLGVFAMIGWYSLQRAIGATEVREYISGVIDVPVWMSKWIIPIGSLAFCIELAIDTGRHLRIVFRGLTE